MGKLKTKIYVRRISNQDKYNEIDIDKSEIFLENLQDFVVDVGLAKIDTTGTYEHNGKSYDSYTYYTLFGEDIGQDNERITESITLSEGDKKRRIDDFGDGGTLRYSGKHIELLIIFLENKIKLIFYCSIKDRKRMLDSLLKFCEIMEPHY